MLKSKLHSLALVVLLVAVLPAIAMGGSVAPAAMGTPPVENLDTGEFFAGIQDAIDDTDTLDGHTLEMKVASHTTITTQIAFDKSLTLQAGASGDTLTPGSDTGSSGDARGWFLIDSGKSVTFSGLTLDGTGSLVYNAIRNHGTLTVENCVFTEIKYNESGPNYAGVGVTTVAASGALTVTDCSFSEIGRIGLQIFGDATVSGCTYTGKGPGNWLDYFICLDSQGASIGDAVVDGCTVSGNRGIAVSDGTWSGGMLISTALGLGTEAEVTNSNFSDNIIGVAVGVDGADLSSVDIMDSNFTDNSFGVVNTSTINIISAVNNYWGAASGPIDVQGSNEADSPPCFPATFVLGTDVVNSDGTGDMVSNGNVDYCPWLDIASPCLSVDTAEDCEYLTSNLEGPDLADFNNVIVVHYNAGVTPGTADISNVAFIEVRNAQFATFEIPGVAGGTAADPYNYALNVVLPVPTSDGTNLPPALTTLDSMSGGIGEPGFGGIPALWTLDFYDGVNSPGDLAGSRFHTVLYGGYPDGVCDLEQTFSSFTEQFAQTVFDFTDGIYHSVTDPEVFVPTATTWDGAAFATPVVGLDPGQPFLYSEANQIDIGNFTDAPLLTGSADPGFVTVWVSDFCTTDTVAGVATNRMGLDIVDPQACYQAGDIIEVQLNMACLEEDVTVFAASVNYDPTRLSLEPSSYTSSPFPLHILSPIMDSGAPVGTINLDGSVGFGMPGTSENALLATLFFKVLPGGNGMPASIAFDTVGPFPSEFSKDGSPVPTRLSNPPGFVIDQMGPTIFCSVIFTANDPGLCSALVDPGMPTVMDDCGIESVVGVRSDALPLDDPYPAGCAPGAVTMITWTGTDCAGNTSMCIQTITVVDNEAPVITSPPADVMVNADAGSCSAVVDFVDPAASDACGGPVTFIYAPPSGSSFPLGTTAVSVTAMDDCGNLSAPMFFDVEVLPFTEVTVTVELVGVRVGPVSRCIYFVGGDCSDTHSETLVFTDHDANLLTPVQATATFDVACGPNATLCAKDEQHTLWGSTTLSAAGTTFVGDTIISLEGGDTDNDGDCDANDVSWYLFQFGTLASPGGCPWDGVTRDADFSDNGAVSTGDYAFLVDNYLTTSDCPCTVPSTAGGSGGQAVNRVSTMRLPKSMRGLDRNGDGVFDHVDVRAFEVEHGFTHELSTKMSRAR